MHDQFMFPAGSPQEGIHSKAWRPPFGDLWANIRHRRAIRR